MNALERYDQIENYLKNRLSPEARAAFEAELSADPTLADEVSLHRDMLEATVPADVLDLRRLLEETYQAESARPSPQTGEAPFGRRSRPLRWLAIAAVILAVALAIWQLQRSRSAAPAP